MHEHEKNQVNRRTFLGESAGMFVGGLGCFGTLEGLRAALAVAIAQQKPLLTEESLNAFLAQARTRTERQLMVKEATADLRGFLGKHFVVDAKDGCTRVLLNLSRHDTAKINQAILEGFAKGNHLRVEIADVALQSAAKPRVGLARTQTIGNKAQITTIQIQP